MDYPFFHPNINEFSLIIHNELRCTKTVMSRGHWRVLRALMGPPRLFSKAYISSQRQLLADYRENIRRVREGGDSSVSLPFDWIPSGFTPNARVLVVHPRTREMHSAVITQMWANESAVTFFQSELGTARIPNGDIMPHAQVDELPAPAGTVLPEGTLYKASTYTYSKIINPSYGLHNGQTRINNQVEMRILLDSKEE